MADTNKFLKKTKEYDEFREKMIHYAQHTISNYVHETKYNGKKHSAADGSKEILSKLEKIAKDNGVAIPNSPSESFNKKTLLDYFGVDLNTFNDYMSTNPEALDINTVVTQLQTSYNQDVQQHVASEAVAFGEKERSELVNMINSTYAPNKKVLDESSAKTNENIRQIAVNLHYGDGKIGSKTTKGLKIWKDHSDNYKKAA